MASSSEKAGPANRAAWFIILAALLLAFASGTMFSGAEAPAERAPVAEAAAPAAVAKAPAEAQAPLRSYHAEETSHRAGTIGFWLLFSLWAVLLSAGVAPRLMKALRRSCDRDLANGQLTLR